MRLTCWLFGREVFALDLGPATADDEPDTGAALNGGTAASTPISFTASWPTPAEWQPPERTLPWEVEEP